MVPMAVIGSVIIGIFLLLFSNRKVHRNPYIIVLTFTDEAAEKKALALLQTLVQRYVLKTKSVSQSGTELTAEIRLKDQNTEFVQKLYAIDGVKSAVLVSYNGEYMS